MNLFETMFAGYLRVAARIARAGSRRHNDPTLVLARHFVRSDPIVDLLVGRN